MPTGDAWADYVSATQRLGELRRRERERTGGRERSVAAARKEVAALSDQLVEQQADLTRLAQQLRLPTPSFGPAGRSEVTGNAALGVSMPVEDRLERARQCLHDANVAADTADDLGDQPALLPTLRPRARNAVIYAAASGLGLLAQIVMIGLSSQRFVTDKTTVYAWTCCGFPAMAFFLGYLAVGVLGRPRRSTRQVDRTPRMGAVICAASLPVYALVASLLGQLMP